MSHLALTGGTVCPSPTEEPVRDAVVLVHDGRIAAVGARAAVGLPAAVESLDCSGLTVLAGFWNSHVHFMQRKWAEVAAIPAPELGRQLRDMLTRFGFTSVFDLAFAWDNMGRLRDRIESGEVPGPRIRSTGMVLSAPGAPRPRRCRRSQQRHRGGRGRRPGRGHHGAGRHPLHLIYVAG